MLDFLNTFVDSSDFMPRRQCGPWTTGLIWLHVGSDLLIWLAYLTIPCLLWYFARPGRDPRFRRMFWMFCGFTITCGMIHLFDAMAFLWPAYRLMGVAKLVTAVVSWATVIGLAPMIPVALTLRSPASFEREIDEQNRTEQTLAQQAGLLHLTHDAIMSRDLDGTIRFFNRGAERRYGWTWQEAVGRTSHVLLQTTFPEPVEEINAKLIRDGMWEGELLHTPREGGKIVVASRWVLEWSERGEPLSVLEINNDITARKRVEAKYLGLLELAPDAIVVVDESRNIVLVNSATETLFGYSGSELTGKNLEVLVGGPLDRWLSATDGIDPGTTGVHAVENGHAVAFRKDGTEFPFELSVSHLEGDEGLLTTIALRDITIRKQAEEALRRKDHYLRLLIEGVQDYAIFMLDIHGCIASWNSGAERIKGYQAAEVIGRHFSRFHPPESVVAGKPEREMRIAAAEGRYEEEGWRIRKDGSAFWASVMLTPLHDSKGRLTGFAKIVRDVTGRKRAEEEAEARTQREHVMELEAANKELEAFSYSVSHDLRAPLRAIDGFSRILIEDYGNAFPQEATEYLQLVRTNAQQMGSLVDALLAFARLNRQPINKQSINMNRLVRRCLDKLHGDHEGRRVELTVGDLPAAKAEPMLVEQVWMNLLANAIKYTRYREVTSIEVGTFVADSGRAELVYFVKDNGVGFDMRYIKKLFGVFQRLHRSEEFEGTGVGLAMVQRIVERHGGRVWAESELDKGATFFFSLGTGELNDR